MRKNSNAARRVAEEAVSKIRFRAEFDIANRERAGAETSAKVEAEMKEKVDSTRKSREAKAKAEAIILQGKCY